MSNITVNKSRFWQNLFKKRISLHISYDPVSDETTAHFTSSLISTSFMHLGGTEETVHHAEKELTTLCKKHGLMREKFSDLNVYTYATRAEYDKALLTLVS